MPKTAKEKLTSAQQIIQGLKKQLKAADHIIKARGEQINQMSGQYKADIMFYAYMADKYGKDGELRIKRGELYKYAQTRTVISRVDEETNEIVIRCVSIKNK